jgi:hypothetical protein
MTFRRRARITKAPGVLTEHREQAALIAWADKARGLYMVDRADDFSALDLLFAIPNAGGFSGGFEANVVRVAKLKREGVRPGVPDLMLALPLGRYPGLFIEMKRADGGAGASAEQRRFIARLQRVGYLGAICNGFDEARIVVEAYLSAFRMEYPE